ncbi:EAL domain-containing protein [Ancylobacter sp. 6x-1]|uniref:EAL domain-containing protein n=1 Tax=Ancylobacter crimeensis TaxID=2579147 RepID=A0ABT0DAK2_9HYPH|nr:EAL domain-containing protein [Ancylobacter crimeensis]MCK0196817.1 EAL domain-containing protein [Ancylobacter crimeensis]
MSSSFTSGGKAELPVFRPEGLELLRRPVWVLHLGTFHKVFANAAALVLWKAETREELFERDYRPHSAAIRKRLGDLSVRIAAGEIVSERWTFYPQGEAVHVDCVMSGVRLPDGAVGMLSEAAASEVGPDDLRGVEALRHTSVCVTLFDTQGLPLFYNPAAGISYGDVDRTFVERFANRAEGEMIWARMLGRIASVQDPFMTSEEAGDFAMITSSGRRWHRLHALATIDPLMSQPAILVNERDITEQVAARERVEYLAAHDVVTGLANRAEYNERLGLEVRQRPGAGGALLLVDLDDFKSINDTFGHGAGDAVLREVGLRLSAVTRPGELAARLGGDEFSLILPGVATSDTVSTRAEEILLRLRYPVFVSTASGPGIPVTVGASIGAAIWPDDGKTPEILQRNADLALYAAKSEDGLDFRCFDRNMRHAAEEQRELVEQLGRALARRQFEVHFQPLISLHERIVAGLEALVRWRHPVRGLLSPARFIHLAESAGFLPSIGAMVLEEACARLSEWRGLGLDPGRVAVNLSASQLRDRNLPRFVLDTTMKHGLTPDRIELEVPETVTLGRAGENAIGILSDLRSLGFSIALDDFGTGYASLTHLRRLPVDKIKIDLSFIAGMSGNAADLAIVRAMVNLGHDLGMTVLAEGIETEEQADLLVKLGCDEVQGFLFGRPMPAEGLLAWLRQRQVTEC